MSMALNGNLEDFGIADVFQLIGQQAKTGVLEIRDRKLCMKLVFDGGSIVWASPAEASEYAELGDRMVRSGLLTRDRLSALMAECRSSARSLPALAVSSGVCPESEIEEIREAITQFLWRLLLNVATYVKGTRAGLKQQSAWRRAQSVKRN